MESKNIPVQADPGDIVTKTGLMSSRDPQESLADIHTQEFIDEYLKDQELGELDLGSMEDACTLKSFDSIPTRKMQLHQEALVKAKVQNKLGVYH